MYLQAAEAAALHAPGLLEGVTDGSDGAALSEMEERTCDGGKEVSMLVRVNVGDIDAGALKLLHLSEGFPFDFIFTDTACERVEDEFGERGAERFSVCPDEGGNIFRS